MKFNTSTNATLALSMIAFVLSISPHRAQTLMPRKASVIGSCAVEITSLKPGDKVGPSVTVKGVGDIPANGYLWILARKKSLGNQWWPQAGGPVEIDEHHSWEAEVFFGRPSDVGSIFEVAAVVVTRQTNEELVNWFATAKALDYPPVAFPNSAGCQVVTVKVEKSR
jgi:hypothetical protein